MRTHQPSSALPLFNGIILGSLSLIEALFKNVWEVGEKTFKLITGQGDNNSVLRKEILWACARILYCPIAIVLNTIASLFCLIPWKNFRSPNEPLPYVYDPLFRAYYKMDYTGSFESAEKINYIGLEEEEEEDQTRSLNSFENPSSNIWLK